jgi:hypothetical protein
MRVFVTLFALITIFVSTKAFRYNIRAKRNSVSRSALLSYADQLKKARQARSGSVPATQTLPSTPAVSLASQDSSGNSGTPFSDEVYEHLTFVISQLSGRIKSESALSPSDLDKFRASCDAIIVDMNRGAPTMKEDVVTPPVTSANSVKASARIKSKPEVWIPQPEQSKNRKSIDEADPDSPFAPLHGMGNTWQLKGMEQMTTEEYYDGIYKRMAVMKDLRQKDEGYTRESSRDYLDSINQKNRTGL